VSHAILEVMKVKSVAPMHHLDDHGKFCHPRSAGARGLVAVVATLSKGYDLEYIWKQVDRGPAKDAASYYLQASETGGEPPGRWWGPGARAIGFNDGQQIDREPYDLLFGERQAPDGTQLGRSPANARKAADLYAQLLAAEPHATAERKRDLRTEAVRKARQSPLFFDLTLSLSNPQVSRSRSSTPPSARTPGWPGRPATMKATATGPPWSPRSTR
jgi:TrwC relaxase